MTIEKRIHTGKIVANMAQVLCFTCKSYGKPLFEQFNGYAGSDPISHVVEGEALRAAQRHDTDHPEHKIVYHRFDNTAVPVLTVSNVRAAEWVTDAIW